MNTFAEEMARRISDLEARARAAGSNMTQVCKKAGVARVTYERWRDRAPQSVQKLDQLAAEVTKLEQQASSTTQAAA